MAYSKDKYQLTNLLQDAWFRMGQMRRWKVTGGTQSTVVNTAWAGVEDAIFEDDDGALIYGTVVVIEDAAGTGAAPEGEMGRITDYDSASQTITMHSVSSTISSGDKIGIASPLLPLEDMLEAANAGLQKIGEIEIPDTSLSIIAGQTEYALPTAIRQRPIRVRIQTVQDSNDNKWSLVQGWDVIPSTAGSNWTLVLPNLQTNYRLEVLYRAQHPRLTAFDSVVIDSIHPELALAAVVAEAYQWYNNMLGGTNTYFLQRENKALQDLEAALVKYPTKTIVEQVQGLRHWGTSGRYVPGTSDLRY